MIQSACQVAYVAAVGNNLITMPLQLISTRCMVSRSSISAWSEVRALVQVEGFWALWNGLGPSMVLCLNPAITFMIVEQVRSSAPTAY